MSSTKELRRRIKSVKSTKQITKAMELISASKMRKASSSTLASRPYTQRTWQILHDITNNTQEQVSHPLLEMRENKQSLVICIASDRGLAGAFTTNIIKETIGYINSNPQSQVDVIVIGKKAAPLLKTLGANLIQVYPHFSVHPTTTDIRPFLDFALVEFEAKKYDRVLIVYTEFFSVMKQEVLTRQLLPLNLDYMDLTEMKEQKSIYKIEKETLFSNFKYEPNPLSVLNTLLPRFAEVLLYQAVIESLASEHSARRIAMKNATDNAVSMLDDLTLTYNGLRQSAITNEIAEITSGAAAL